MRTTAILTRLARLEGITPLEGPAPKGSVQTVVDDATYHLPLADVSDIEQERARLEKTVAKHQAEIKSIDGRLGNEAFVAKAPESVVAENCARREELVGLVEKLGLVLKRLGGGKYALKI